MSKSLKGVWLTRDPVSALSAIVEKEVEKHLSEIYGDINLYPNPDRPASFVVEIGHYSLSPNSSTKLFLLDAIFKDEEFQASSPRELSAWADSLEKMAKRLRRMERKTAREDAILEKIAASKAAAGLRS